MKKKMVGIFTCIMVIVATLSLATTSGTSQSVEKNSDGPHLNFLVGAGAIGWNVIIWNYGNEPAYFVYWEIETRGVNDTKILGGNRRGVIPCLRSIDSQYMAPLTLPKRKNVYPFGSGEVEITVKISCRTTNYDVSFTSNWILQGLVLRPDYSPF